MKNLWTKRIIQYILGMLLMALAVVVSKRSAFGLAPFSSAPAALNTITGISLGITTIMLHIVCVIVSVICQRKVTVKTVLTFFVAFPFGWMIDLMMPWIPATDLLWLRIVYLILGIAVTALGVAMIVGADLMLPAPDAMLRTISVVFKKPYPLVKNCGDIFWFALASISELIVFHTVYSVGIGTILCAIFVGRGIKLINKVYPKIMLVEKPSL